MKTLMLLAFIALVSGFATAHADIKGAPFIPEIDTRFNNLEENYYEASPGIKGHHVQQLAQVEYNFSTYTGATGTYDLGFALPANVLITRVYAYSKIKPTTSASGTLAFQCGNAGNLMAATAAASFAAAGSAVDGVETGTAANMLNYGSPGCEIKAVVATGALTAGDVVLFVNYVTHQ